jgi:hypothetical protein
MGLAGYRRRAGKGAGDKPWEAPNPGTENGYRGWGYVVRNGEEWCGKSERGWASESRHSVAARGAAWLRGLCTG